MILIIYSILNLLTFAEENYQSVLPPAFYRSDTELVFEETFRQRVASYEKIFIVNTSEHTPKTVVALLIHYPEPARFFIRKTGGIFDAQREFAEYSLVQQDNNQHYRIEREVKAEPIGITLPIIGSILMVTVFFVVAFIFMKGKKSEKKQSFSEKSVLILFSLIILILGYFLLAVYGLPLVLFGVVVGICINGFMTIILHLARRRFRAEVIPA